MTLTTDPCSVCGLNQFLHVGKPPDDHEFQLAKATTTNLWYVFIDMEGDFVPSGRHYFDMNHREKLEGPRGVRYRLEIVAPTAMDAEVIGLLAAGEKGELYAIYYAGVKPTS